MSLGGAVAVHLACAGALLGGPESVEAATPEAVAVIRVDVSEPVAPAPSESPPAGESKVSEPSSESDAPSVPKRLRARRSTPLRPAPRLRPVVDAHESPSAIDVAAGGEAVSEDGTSEQGAVEGSSGNGAGEGRGGSRTGPLTGAGGGHRMTGARGARLVASSARCNDLFPFGARAEEGRVTIAVEVAPDGSPATARVVRAAPRGDGFDRAALICARRLEFVPARDETGRVVASRAVVRLGFRRN